MGYHAPTGGKHIKGVRTGAELHHMCFPGKRQKANFAEKTNKPATPASASTTNPNKPSTTTRTTTSTMAGPKIAIVIYSMYGHIAKRESVDGIRCG